MQKKVALIIGHNARSKGAWSNIIGSEYDYWKRVAKEIEYRIGHIVDVYERQPSKNYIQEMNPVIKAINDRDYKFAIELHYNSASNEKANGCEVLAYYKSKKGKELANRFNKMLSEKFQVKIRNKGIIEVENSSTNGAYGIINTDCPYILTEPFFGSNPEETLKFSIIDDVVDLYIDFIKKSL